MWTILAVAAVLCAALAPTADARKKLPCKDRADASRRLEFRSGDGRTFAYYALPARRPLGLVVLAHGYGGTAKRDLRPALEVLARDFGVIAVGPEFRGIVPPVPGETRSRGFPLAAGSQDTVVVSRIFARACPRVHPRVAMGFSMGGAISGLAVAARRRARDGSRLYDNWITVSGVADVRELYYQGRFLLLLNPEDEGIRSGLEDIRAEMGGTPEEKPAVYEQSSPLYRTADIKASKLAGAIVVHAAMDGLVTGDQGLHLGARLFAAGVPTEGYAVGTRRPDSAVEQLMLDERFIRPLLPAYSSPFAGHIGYTVYGVAYGRLLALVHGEAVRSGVGIVDGQTGLSLDLRPPIGLG